VPHEEEKKKKMIIKIIVREVRGGRIYQQKDRIRGKGGFQKKSPPSALGKFLEKRQRLRVTDFSEALLLQVSTHSKNEWEIYYVTPPIAVLEVGRRSSPAILPRRDPQK